MRRDQGKEINLLIPDLEAKGFKVSYSTVEIGSLGHYTSDATKAITSLVPAIPTTQVKLMLTTLGKVSIACLYHIFNARDSAVWPENKPLYRVTAYFQSLQFTENPSSCNETLLLWQPLCCLRSGNISLPQQQN